MQDSKFYGMQVECEPPSDRIYSFQGVMKSTDGAKISLMYDNFALRGCRLRNTEYIIGCVAYVGPDTRIMRNSVLGKPKKSQLEKLVNATVLGVFIMDMICSAMAAFYVMIWEKIYQDNTNCYLDFFPSGEVPTWSATRGAKIWFKSFFTWILLFTNMVPISLLVTMEMVKFFQAMFIQWDWRIYSVEKNMPTKV